MHLEKARGLRSEISSERRAVLGKIAAYVRSALHERRPPQLVFVCTHNSRRSHLGQVWAQIAAHAHGLHSVRTYSAGTEVTACHPNTLTALESCGVQVHRGGETENPRAVLSFGPQIPSTFAWSKTIHDPSLPQAGHCAVMVCGSADAKCPFLPNAHRIGCTYVDPKISDGSPAEAETYLARSLQIACEMDLVMQVAQQET
jgi:protein-tyrosine-phosphatase